jgi:cytochrome c5
MNQKNTFLHPARRKVFSVMIIVAATFIVVQHTNAAPTKRQSTLMLNNCMQCHARPDTGAPFIGVADDWQEAVVRGEEAMLVNVVQGIRGMPPLGYCSACSEEDLRVLIRTLSGMPDTEGKMP